MFDSKTVSQKYAFAQQYYRSLNFEGETKEIVFSTKAYSYRKKYILQLILALPFGVRYSYYVVY